MPNKPATNGEYYDHERQQWFVMCGPDSVPFRKVDARGNDIVPETAVQKDTSHDTKR